MCAAVLECSVECFKITPTAHQKAYQTHLLENNVGTRVRARVHINTMCITIWCLAIFFKCCTQTIMMRLASSDVRDSGLDDFLPSP